MMRRPGGGEGARPCHPDCLCLRRCQPLCLRLGAHHSGVPCHLLVGQLAVRILVPIGGRHRRANETERLPDTVVANNRYVEQHFAVVVQLSPLPRDPVHASSKLSTGLAVRRLPLKISAALKLQPLRNSAVCLVLRLLVRRLQLLVREVLAMVEQVAPGADLETCHILGSCGRVLLQPVRSRF